MNSSRADDMSSGTVKEQLERAAEWLKRLPQDEWSIYSSVMTASRERGLRFAIGGGFATMIYSGHWRDSKDIDFFVLERDKDEMIQILSKLGLEDYYDRDRYERHWIYRSYKGEVIVDVIWAMANRRASVDEAWLEGPRIEIGEASVRLVPPEETLWNKLYVMQRDRSDWPDGINLLYAVGPDLNWSRLFARLEDDIPLLSGLLSVFRWICPDRARSLPADVWNRLDAAPPEAKRPMQPASDRASLLDSRPWFAPTVLTDGAVPDGEK